MAVTHYTLQVSNHRDAARLPANAAASESWQTVYDGPIASAKEARAAVDGLAKWYRYVRAFRGVRIGRLWYEVTQ